tara:strand:- start:287 stop:406 length:120 start_codon:yes stop_codon:yes gene_type:complete
VVVAELVVMQMQNQVVQVVVEWELEVILQMLEALETLLL